MYGMGVNSLKVQLGSSSTSSGQATREEAQKYLDEYFNKFNGLAKYLENVKAETEQRGYTETYFGRRRYFEGLRSKIPFIRAMAERMAINAPIQGTEADLIKLAMVKIDEFIVKEKLEDKVRLILNVHDELVYEVAGDTVEKIKDKLESIMENIIPKEKIKGIVLESKYSVGENWKEMA
jgi:DNA polymerase-1